MAVVAQNSLLLPGATAKMCSAVASLCGELAADAVGLGAVGLSREAPPKGLDDEVVLRCGAGVVLRDEASYLLLHQRSQGVPILVREAFGADRIPQDNLDGPRVEEVRVLLHHVVRAAHRHWHYRKLRVNRQHQPPLFEGPHAPVGCACPLGADPEALALALVQLPGELVAPCHSLDVVLAVDEDCPCAPYSPAQQRDVGDGLLCEAHDVEGEG
mmetsp:Transcript_6797/g.15607  ORF Transcript_6797/g.15607 Transcript_6797/m.15607 type:complete len:214 (+) Transcript_6797:120-761(+)|eukprot:CAMPEP_0114178708 /NCGR_PEP_ID=MMETSP0043_2-20121206/38688_1 /TAXON_ID=464988 /ORGANISM="Hemiselmis andersenii, Strain CCMP644" /LENGTH=213 /DNA_ID=CAMNT_0001277139 /DNA_START=46 /DNA_END=687 /DNA_ORIENTATION=-